MKKIGLYWFTNDLRVHDHPGLMRACQEVDELICVFVLDSAQTTSSAQNPRGVGSHVRLGKHRHKFLQQSLSDLQQALKALGQGLLILNGRPLETLQMLISDNGVSDVFTSQNAGYFEKEIWQALASENSSKRFHRVATHTLFYQDQLPFEPEELPASFTKFRKLIEAGSFAPTIANLQALPPVPQRSSSDRTSAEIKLAAIGSTIANQGIEATIAKPGAAQRGPFSGGESAGLNHLSKYLSGNLPSHYKEVRNALDGWDNSCKFSPWLANGCLSVREVAEQVLEYEQRNGANDSTYWIYFELLWREYFQWYAHLHGNKLFAAQGIATTAPLTSFYPERFKKWTAGTTPYPLVNACMNELAATGYLSNRGRQIVASCFVNELSLDWRYGAAYFEHMLVDYDVASNWGNWQYIAGVGADTRGGRHFNLQKQTEIFDPQGAYITRWNGSGNGDTQLSKLDSVDAADWPIT